jgi:hypothetical protein
MRNSPRNASRLLALFTVFVLSACASSATTSQPFIPSVSPFARVAGARSILVITQKTSSGGVTKYLPNVPVQLWLCKSSDYRVVSRCATDKTQRTTIAQGTTDKSGRATLHATFVPTRILCVAAFWQKDPNGASADGSCPFPLPDTVIIEFGVPKSTSARPAGTFSI